MATVACPVCTGPIVLEDPSVVAACRVGHTFPDDELIADLTKTARRALWAALTALADEAAATRWRAAQQPAGQGEPLLQQAKTIDEQVALLRKLIANE